MKIKKAQSAIEFVILIGTILFFILGLMLVFQQKVSQEGLKARNEIIQNLALQIQNEISIAAKSSDGYSREFDLPQLLANKNYTINFYGDYLYINTTDGKNSIGLTTQNATGQFQKGKNKITKINSTIFLN